MPPSTSVRAYPIDLVNGSRPSNSFHHDPRTSALGLCRHYSTVLGRFLATRLESLPRPPQTLFKHFVCSQIGIAVGLLIRRHKCGGASGFAARRLITTFMMTCISKTNVCTGMRPDIVIPALSPKLKIDLCEFSYRSCKWKLDGSYNFL
jgi:hypothetical protein